MTIILNKTLYFPILDICIPNIHIPISYNKIINYLDKQHYTIPSMIACNIAQKYLQIHKNNSK